MILIDTSSIKKFSLISKPLVVRVWELENEEIKLLTKTIEESFEEIDQYNFTVPSPLDYVSRLRTNNEAEIQRTFGLRSYVIAKEMAIQKRATLVKLSSQVSEGTLYLVSKFYKQIS